MNDTLEVFTKKPEFLIVGDIHLSNTAPSCRIDNYSETCINKLEYVLDYCIINEIEVVVIEGDVFHKHQIPIPYLSIIITKINEKKEEFKRKYNKDLLIASIIGNHDLPFENYKYIDRSPIFLMFETKTISHFNHIKIKSLNEDIDISGFDYSKEIEKSKCKNECCVAHCFFGFDFLNANSNCFEEQKDRLSEEKAKELGYSVYFLGHDHTFYDIVSKDGYKVVRPGSLLRNSSHKQQISRIPCFYHVKKKGNDYVFDKIEISIALSSNAVFNHESLIKPKKQELDESVKTKISDIIFSLSEEEKQGDSVDEILKNIIKEKNINKEIQNVILSYFSRENVSI